MLPSALSLARVTAVHEFPKGLQSDLERAVENGAGMM